MPTAAQLDYQNKAVRLVRIIREEALQSGIHNAAIQLDGGSMAIKRGNHEVHVTSQTRGTTLVKIESDWFEHSDAGTELLLRLELRTRLRQLAG
jgi:hypothetical protein